MFQPSQDDLTTNGSHLCLLHERVVALTSASLGRQIFERAAGEGLRPSPVGLVERLERQASPQARATVAG